jgi:chemotaxis protein CheD
MSERLIVGIGELAVASGAETTIVTHALGSCIAVCLWDPDARVAGMLHFLLPDSRLNPERARQQPGAFADTGIPLLFQTAYRHGADKKRCRVKLLGGAAIAQAGHAGLDVGKRNALAARRLLWQNGVMVQAEALGGSTSRTVALSAADGRLRVSCGRELIQEL